MNQSGRNETHNEIGGIAHISPEVAKQIMIVFFL